ncbi:RsiV family protein [Tissierella creatinophila]|uniref:Anti-sigma-V factor RsiV n=1 Tax=Tissierella creatinophila DSM 6911 TaxID=1123403 RepID=A0A1U7M902_TISCR|nr:RsiV family protein [Tissierella creatinophila]OLS03792.1 anti-sigma-V factor RsiV [Tissierella creatinophila DSM 6911]
MFDKKIEQLKEDYKNIPIPKELDSLIEQTLRERRIEMRKQKSIRKALTLLSSVAALFVLVIAGVNTSFVIADSLGNIPVIGSVVKVLTFREYKIDQDHYQGNIVTPKIEGLENENLQNSLNEKYLKENKKLYEEFMKEIEDLKENGQGYLGVDSGYIVKTDTDEIFSIARYKTNTAASSSTEFTFDTISKKDNILITLPSLFKDDKYIEIISENIKEQMIENNKKDDSKIYWLEELGNDLDNFEKIAPDQHFYIDENSNLIISFDEYEVAPGFMGVLEFTIPTKILSDILISNDYIK